MIKAEFPAVGEACKAIYTDLLQAFGEARKALLLIYSRPSAKRAKLYVLIYSRPTSGLRRNIQGYTH